MQISIIIPVYNASNYLYQCIESVVNQSFPYFEVLLINDGSTDESGAICDEYAKKDDRIKVFHKKNEGVSVARNLGITESNGEWICFVDSDDYVSENYLLAFIEILSQNENIDFVIQGFVKLKDSNEYKRDLGDEVMKASNFNELFINKNIQNFGYPFSKFYRKQIIIENEILFPEDYTIAEDLSFLLIYLSKIKTIKFQKTHNYYYRHTENSLSNRLRKPEIYFARYFGVKKIIKDNYKELYKDIFSSSAIYKSFQHNIGSALFQSILSLYFFDLDKKKRLSYLEKLDDDDRILLGCYKSKFRNPIFKNTLALLQKQKIKVADKTLYSFFNIRKMFLQVLGKPIHYKFKK